MLDLIVDSGDQSVALYVNKKYVGCLAREIDGYYVYWPNIDNGGFMSQEFLAEIVENLKDLNQVWHEMVCRDLGESNENQNPR